MPVAANIYLRDINDTGHNTMEHSNGSQLTPSTARFSLLLPLLNFLRKPAWHFILALAFVCVSAAAKMLTMHTETPPQAQAQQQTQHEDTGLFLVATEQLTHTSFQETVILIIHNSEQGATGLAINRPSTFQLKEIFPDVPSFRNQRDEVYLGGPVQTNSVFVLLRTQNPRARMYNIAKDLYFSSGIDALVEGLQNISSDEHARAYVGFSGWAPGQLEFEIQRGDWLVVHADTDIVFDQDYHTMWKKLFKSWSGQWI